MKIVQTPVRFPPYIGGTEKVAFYLSRQLVKQGHNVKVICADEPPVGDGRIENIEVSRLPFIGKIANTNITLSLVKVLMEEDFDIIHTHLPHPWSADISAVISLIKNKPLFLTYHNDIVGRGFNKMIANFYNFTLLKLLLKRAYKIFITSSSYLEKSPFLKPFENKIVVTPPGVDLEKFRPLALKREEANTVFFMSKLDKFHRYKGLEYLLLSIKEVIKKVSLKLYIGGEGKLIEDYKNIVKKYGLEKAVNFLGYLTEEELVRYYNLCDVFVLPSISCVQEGFGLVALEAMACKKAVIVTDVVGVAQDVKSYEAGIVVPPKNINALTNALEYIFFNDRKKRVMEENALELVKRKYTWDKHGDIVERDYLRMVK